MLNLSQMDEAIRLTEIHMSDCQINQNFKEANETKQLLLKMKTIRDLTEREEIKENFYKAQNAIEEYARSAMEELNQYYAMLLDKLHNQKNKALQHLWIQQRGDLQRASYYKKPQNPEYLKLQKIMNYLSNQKEFLKAEMYQVYLKEANDEHMRKTLSDQKYNQESQQRSLKQKHLQQEEVLINKFNDQEQLIKAEMIKKIAEIEQKRVNQMHQITQEKNNKMSNLERNRTKSIKVQIQSQMEEIEKCSYFMK